MLNALIIALTLAAPAASSPDIAASDAIVVPVESLSPYERKLKRMAGEDAWKYSILELHAMFNGLPFVIEQYTDPKHGSNGGVDWA